MCSRGVARSMRDIFHHRCREHTQSIRRDGEVLKDFSYGAHFSYKSLGETSVWKSDVCLQSHGQVNIDIKGGLEFSNEITHDGLGDEKGSL
ncbi:hypothetical protein Tco_0856505 [Tanacetum coccineum]|uniref:Uncharacterized protein n=1 Tax=Tanacetum coccineum TaxID=301880 RepID=A0ABQ5B6N2_9ASTR